MRTLYVDRASERAIVRESMRLRARRQDQPARKVMDWTKAQAKRECLEQLMSDNRSPF